MYVAVVISPPDAQMLIIHDPFLCAMRRIRAVSE